jgi:hypothetical protein
MNLDQALRAIQTRKLTQKGAAVALSISDRHMRRLMDERGVEMPTAKYLLREKAAEDKRVARREAALSVIKGNCTPETAAASVDCSVRTLYRYISEVDERISEENRVEYAGK